MVEYPKPRKAFIHSSIFRVNTAWDFRGVSPLRARERVLACVWLRAVCASVCDGVCFVTLDGVPCVMLVLRSPAALVRCELGGAWLRGVCAVARGASRSARRFRPRRPFFRAVWCVCVSPSASACVSTTLVKAVYLYEDIYAL